MVDEWADPTGETRGDGEGEAEKMYFSLSGPVLMGSRDEGLGGNDISEPSSSSPVISAPLPLCHFSPSPLPEDLPL